MLTREDPSGRQHIQGTTANTMRPADEAPTPTSVADKASRMGQAVHDAVVGPSDPQHNVKDLSSDDKPDGLEVSNTLSEG